ncbi:MAG: L,D-transpeptidase family protein [Nitrospira sp.]|nr:MAG: L,D-transpeptidase family protein [Nitrospira sp.]
MRRLSGPSVAALGFWALWCLHGAERPVLAADRISPCAIHYPSDRRIAWQCRRLQRGETLESLFGSRWQDVARFNRIDRRHVQPGREIKVPLRPEEVAQFHPLPSRYPLGEQEDKLILVDLSEQFLGAYERGILRFALPIATGGPDHPTPIGDFRITAAHRTHRSCLYTVEGTDVPYPMHYALRFHVDGQGSYWMHGRDLPGYPASHGCIGLSDEQMQQRYYGAPAQPALADAKRLYEWVVGEHAEEEAWRPIPNGPRVVISGQAPRGYVSGVTGF